MSTAGAPAPATPEPEGGLVAAPRRADRGRDRSLPDRLRRLGCLQRRLVARRRVADPAQRHARQLPRAALAGSGEEPAPVLDLPLRPLARQLARDCAIRGALERPARGTRCVRIQPLPFPRTADGPALPAPDPDVPAGARARRDLPDRAEDGSGVPVHGPRHEGRPAARLSRWCDGDQHLADEGVLRHDPVRARRVGAGRRGDPVADLLGCCAAARAADPLGDRDPLVRRDLQRVHPREHAAAVERELHAARRPEGLHRQAVLRALGAVRGGRPARGHPDHDHLHVAAAVHRQLPPLTGQRTAHERDGRGRAGDVARPSPPRRFGRLRARAPGRARRHCDRAAACSARHDGRRGRAPFRRRRRAAERQGGPRRGDGDRRLVPRDLHDRQPVDALPLAALGRHGRVFLGQRPRCRPARRSRRRRLRAHDRSGRPGLAPRLGRLRDLPRPLRDQRRRRRGAGLGGSARLGRAADGTRT